MSEEDLTLPRILCLHGGGVNAQVFRLQCRAIIGTHGGKGLAPHFRFVFVDAPFICPPHPAIVRVYGEYKPFYRWLRWQDDHEEIDPREAASQILSQLKGAMDADAGSGEWVGLLGFSQGAKIAASLLWMQERLMKLGKEPLLKGVEWRFGVLMAGSAPHVMLDPTGDLEIPRHVERADKLSLEFRDWPESNEGEHVVTIPTLHVHGLQDPGIPRHRRLLEMYCQKGTTRLVEWDGDHRLPIKSQDVEIVVNKVVEMAWEMGVL
ncbi:serine hydrolase FSH [Apodospora peruviana]|uniref:Serine hydrolase FSH n=1 Tax=Apodospora peruviana TaxID=516989 RepID=A0AAE0IPR5_9PEZI|nr:serine hydrolase FSH [Apodospora peruviana]